jgi:3-(3-hydroxy-phenyl)propionate hydroxylase
MKPQDIPFEALRGTGHEVAIEFPTGAAPIRTGHARAPWWWWRRPGRPEPGHRPGPARPAGGGARHDYRLSIGSRAICFSKRTLEIWDRLGVAPRMVEKGVSWNPGKVFFHDQQVYQFDLLPEDGHLQPAFINLQQYYAEAYLVERACNCR